MGARRRGISQRKSLAWDLSVPFSIAAIPAVLFTLLGFVTKNLDMPGARPGFWVIAMMIVLQTLGIIAMAVLVLIRFGIAFEELSIRTNGSPAIWRKGVLFGAIVFVLLFDILSNVGAAFAGGGPLVVAAVPALLGYVFCLRLAFVSLE